MTKEELSLCECGCGQETKIYRGKPRRFISGHQNRGIKVYDQMKHKIGAEGLTQDIVRELFDYIDGELYWKTSRGHRKMVAAAGGTRQDDYRRIGIDGVRYYAHRLIFLYHRGYLPEFLDHIDGNPLNNDISNLREATQQENSRNQKKIKSRNGKSVSSIYKGVSWDEMNNNWRSRIANNGIGIYLGSFTNEIEAAEAYNKAAIELFGKFAYVNIIDATKRL